MPFLSVSLAGSLAGLRALAGSIFVPLPVLVYPRGLPGSWAAPLSSLYQPWQHCTVIDLSVGWKAGPGLGPRQKHGHPWHFFVFPTVAESDDPLAISCPYHVSFPSCAVPAGPGSTSSSPPTSLVSSPTHTTPSGRHIDSCSSNGSPNQ